MVAAPPSWRVPPTARQKRASNPSAEAAFGKVTAMTADSARRGAVLLATACSSMALLTGCGGQSAQSSSTASAESGTFSGSSQELGNGSVTTYVALDDEGNRRKWASA